MEKRIEFIETQRLRLRQWRDSDKKPFALMNADQEVMRHFPSIRTQNQSNELVDRLFKLIDKMGYGFWAAERKDSDEFIGFIGINYVDSGLPFAPCVEIGWRLAKAHWGQGFATEGALASLDYGFIQADVGKIVSMTTLTNTPSENVMKKIGMHKCSENFNHPEVPPGHLLSEHVLYELTKSQWLVQKTL